MTVGDVVGAGADPHRAGHAFVEGVIGRVAVVSDGAAVTAVHFAERAAHLPSAVARPEGVLAEAVRQLSAYFAGDLRIFDLPLAPTGTRFQQAVWRELADVPWGRTRTYGSIAASLGLLPGASRAVGAANAAIPIPVILPCHRVIGANGLLTGYAGGLGRKEALLRLEGVATEADQRSLF